MRITRRKTAALVVSAVLAGSLAACSPGGGGSTGSGTVTVYAAASLKKTFTELAAKFEAAHPGTKVTLNFAGSSDLVTQITQGAPADVFASADSKNMTKLSDASLVDGDPVDFATNVLEIAVPPANPASISSFADLAKPGVKVVVCAPQVPCGAATEKVEKASGITLKPVSEESSVADVLGKVTSGEADAGLVYVTDVKTAGDKVKGITFPESGQAANTYPIATVENSKNKELAKAFIELVTGSEGRKVLGDAGFGAP
ncbi:molybdate ABC transporter substrate-binding protein [Arthrobacter cupressi]|uniref:Molybdate-binding protein ModA n=1 Tax=Arthrobacter cupressi TaxID=1045773 RepID=A0A1G8Q9H1_9MICC|nr:molybdate ABC transporter substrate-binding protein [Arthrobacter cupressi]NYD78073.1 molybdate transport system substrate-binding protein [Arthrobacter cupressi]SDJ01469.1 molybdate transport system substrate-binding protein [Arthrobacter cupressi]